MSHLKIASVLIEKIAGLAVGKGNSVKSISEDWKPKQAVFMEQPIAPSMKAEISAEFSDLEAFYSEGTPHNSATEGFIDRTADVVIAFPAPGETRRWY